MLDIGDLDAELIGGFLADLEAERGKSARTRNTRLSAIRSFFKYVSVNEPQWLHHCQRILYLPPKRYVKKVIDFLDAKEILALLDAPDTNTWHGCRDRIILLLTLQTGLRVSELINLTLNDLEFGPSPAVHCLGKGRKERTTPLRKDTVHALRLWLRQRNDPIVDTLFVSQRQQPLSLDAIERIVHRHVNEAALKCPSLSHKNITPHTLRHTCAMQLLQNGVDTTVIALWLWHESIETTQMYLHADMQLKENAIAKTTATDVPKGRYNPPDEILAFLEAL
ncbi:integrase [Cerasicoccus arenae]|uniref:Integrase n=2 Tax=Cerasicoccus arenae TaxID=424488 RepID=A0A8J3GE74_9BACT|nr:integrase [Cerasicoccus arenae]